MILISSVRVCSRRVRTISNKLPAKSGLQDSEALLNIMTYSIEENLAVQQQ